MDQLGPIFANWVSLCLVSYWIWIQFSYTSLFDAYGYLWSCFCLFQQLSAIVCKVCIFHMWNKLKETLTVMLPFIYVWLTSDNPFFTIVHNHENLFIISIYMFWFIKIIWMSVIFNLVKILVGWQNGKALYWSKWVRLAHQHLFVRYFFIFINN